MKKLDKKGIFLITSGAAIAVLTVALICFTTSNRNRITQQNREYLRDNAVQTAQSIDSAITEGYSNIRILSDLISDTLTAPEFNVASIQEHIQNSVFDFIEYADTEGMDHNITGGVSDAHDRQYYLDAREGNSGLELIYVSRATHETLLMFYSPLSYNGEFAGSLVGVYQAANRLTKLLSSYYFDEAATSYLATDTGRIIACSQGFDPQNEMYLTDFAEGDKELEAVMNAALASDGPATFALPGNQTGACLVKLPGYGGYLLQIFPQEASSRMIKQANALGYGLVGILILLYAAVLFSLIRFYREQQKQVEEAKTQAEAANNAKTNFLFSMSHDIRTPMNAIMGFTNMALKHVNDTDRVKDCLNKTQKAGNMLLSLINNVLEVSRIESGHATVEEQPGNVYFSFSNFENTMREMADTKDIRLCFEFGKIRDAFVYADFTRCVRVFVNVLSNAIKYTHSGGMVKVRCEQLGKAENGIARYQYTFTDNGIGMSEEFQKKVFEQFTREDTAAVHGVQGSGLGMSVCKSFVDLMGGTIDVKSRQGEGTVVTIVLPFRVQEGEDYVDPNTGNVTTFHKTAGEKQNKRENFRGKKVLLVEDNDFNREIAREILEEEGLLVEEAEDGKLAVKRMRDKGPYYYDFILMDIQMPNMNGYEATGEIRKMYPNRHIPIVALSANAFEEDKIASAEAGMDDHVAKPVSVNELFNALAKFL